LLSTAKPVYLSVGMHTESEIESVFGQLADFNNWFPMHCVSNYPVVNHNSALGYIKYLAQKWDRPVGFSSHDDFWENNVIALTFGATIFERHITKNRADSGLDHSTSSTPDEFKKLCKIIKDFDLITTGNGPRVPNQGELLNKQNLGRSFYANSNLPTGTLIESEDFSYRSPMTGLAIAEFQETLGERLRFGMNEGDVLTRSHLVDRDIHLSNKQLSEMHRLNVSLPVRLSDYEKVRSQIPVKGFEFHLSYQEVASDLSKFRVHSEDSFSIHLPDYINSNSLINPFSEDREVKHTSITCIERVGDFGRELAKLTEKKIPIVASLSAPMMSREDFYSQVRKLFDIYSSDGVEFTLQWLPPIAWYFGGSVRLEMVNELIDVQFLKENGIPITMDISHLILGRNAFGFDPIEVMESLRGQISHIHLSDAIGIDGEGLQFGDGGLQNERLIKYALTYKQLKVLEVWQGHLEGFFGFKEAIQRLADEKYSIL
jgi:sugar phosphate isomerase/epimerase